MDTKWDAYVGHRRIMVNHMTGTMDEYHHNTRDVMNTTVKVIGAFAGPEVLGLMSVTSEHTQHVDHGWIVRYVLLVNGIKLAEKWIRSDQHGALGQPLADGAAQLGPCKMTIHKASWKHGITKPTKGEEP